MKRTTRSVLALTLGVVAVPTMAAPAAAATVAETAAIGAYYLATNPGNVGGIPQNPAGPQRAPDTARSADGVAPDDLAVAVVVPNGSPDKFSALQFDLLDLVPGSTVSKATLVVPLSTNSGSQSTVKDPNLVVACAVGNEGFADGDGLPMQDAPSVKCADSSSKARAVDGGNAFEFDISALAQRWADANTGLALYPSKEGFARPFQTVFGPKTQARLTLAFTPPAGTADAATLSSGPPVDTGSADTAAVSGTGSAADTGSADTGTVSLTPADASAPVTAAADAANPAVAAPPPQTAAAVPAANTLPPVPKGFDAATWAAVLGGLALLAAVTMSLRASSSGAVPGTPAVRPGGVASTLARRGGRLVPELHTG